MRVTPGVMEVKHKGRRYWGTVDADRAGVRWRFWSDHRWPFYHGHYTQRQLDRHDAMRVFIDWLPFKREP